MPGNNPKEPEQEGLIWDFTVPGLDLSDEDLPTETTTEQKPPDAVTPSPPRKTRRHLGPKSALVQDSYGKSTFVAARRAIEEINLNEAAPEKDLTSSPIIKRNAYTGKFALSPWEMNPHGNKRDANQAKKIYAWACSSELSAARYEFIFGQTHVGARMLSTTAPKSLTHPHHAHDSIWIRHDVPSLLGCPPSK